MAERARFAAVASVEPTTAGVPAVVPDRTARVLCGVLLAGAFAVVLAAVPSPVFELERHAVPKELVLSLVAFACVAVQIRRWTRIRPCIVAALYGTYVTWSVVSAAFATNRWLALNAAGVSFGGLVVFVSARRVARAPGPRRALLTGLVGAAVLAAVLGLAQAYGAAWSILVPERAPGGTFGNRNFLAHFLAIMTPPVVVAALRPGRGRAVLAAGALAPMMGAIVLTRSRAAWLALAASLSVLALAALAGRRAHPTAIRLRRIPLAAGVLAGATALAIVVPNRLEWRSDSPYAETLTRLAEFTSGSGQGRLVQWRNSLRLVGEAPLLGVGPGNWFVHYPRVTSVGDPSFARDLAIPTNPWPSSDWIATLTERGAPGLLLLLATGLAAAAAAIRRVAVRDGPAPDDDSRAARALAALGLVTAAAVAGLFDAVLLLPAPTFFVWTALGALLPRTTPVLDRRPPHWARGVVVAFAVLLAVTSTGRLASLLEARESPTRAQLVRAARLDPGGHRVRLLLATRGPCSDRIPWAREARDRMPFHAAPARALQRCGVRD